MPTIPKPSSNKLTDSLYNNHLLSCKTIIQNNHRSTNNLKNHYTKNQKATQNLEPTKDDEEEMLFVANLKIYFTDHSFCCRFSFFEPNLVIFRSLEIFFKSWIITEVLFWSGDGPKMKTALFSILILFGIKILSTLEYFDSGSKVIWFMVGYSNG